MDPDGPIESINAVTLATADMERSVRFYRSAGFRLAYGGEGADFTSFHAGGGFLNLQPARRGWPADEVWGRVIFWVDDVDAMSDRIRSAGYPTETDPADAPWGERYFHVRDPDGHELSFARPIGGPGAGPGEGPADGPGEAPAEAPGGG